MGNNHSGNIKHVQELVDAVRSKKGAHSEKEALNTVNLRMETATIKNKAQILQDLKLKSISEIIKSDDVKSFQEVIEEGNLNNFERIGSLQLTPLHLAAYHNSPNILKHLLQDPKVLTNVLSNDGNTPLNLALFGAADDASAKVLIRIFEARSDLNILLKNAQQMFPLLITTQRNFIGASKLLLESSAGPVQIPIPIRKKYIIDQYAIWDLTHVIKLALLTNQKDLADFIHQKLGPPRRHAILDKILNSLDAELFADVVNLLSQDLAATFRSTDSSNKTNVTVKYSPKSAADQANETEEVTIRNVQQAKTKAVLTPTPTPMPMSKTDEGAKKKALEVKDARGHIIQGGNIVQMLSAQYIRKALHSSARPADVDKFAGKLALVHGIYGDKIYVEIHGEGEECVVKINPGATVFYSKGITTVLSDGSVGHIASYVQISSIPVPTIQNKNQGIPGWIHGMNDALGKTGKIVRFLRNSDVLVQFAWGPRYFFKPASLIPSSRDKIEAQDSKGNWIRPGSLIQITKFRAEFFEIQKKNKLQFEGDYAHLPWKYATVRSIQLTAFADGKMLQILYRNKPYFVHVDSVELIDSAQDRNNQDIRVGHLVQVIKDAEEFKLVLTQHKKKESRMDVNGNSISDFDKMSKVMGEVGKVTALYNDENRHPSNYGNTSTLMITVEFSASSITKKTLVDLFPGLTYIFVTPVAAPVPALRGRGQNYVKTGEEDLNTVLNRKTIDVVKTGAEDPDNWVEIPRDSLKCFELLGKGGFGCVVRGEWTRNGAKKIVAIKQVNYGLTNAAGPLIEVMAEAKIQFSLRHPNIVSLFGTSLDQDLWIVMDFVDGTDLHTYLDPHDGTDTVFSSSQKIQLCLDMTSAIAFIHLKGYIHCDIKPKNMMVDRTGKLYVCDFGIAEFCGEKQDFVTFATLYADNFGGTVYYIPPECLQENEKTGQYRKPTFAADIWALGAVFYELFTKLHLYENQMQFLTDKTENNDTTIKKRMAGVPQAVRHIVEKALDFNKHSRPTAQQLFEFFHELKSQ